MPLESSLPNWRQIIHKYSSLFSNSMGITILISTITIPRSSNPNLDEFKLTLNKYMPNLKAWPWIWNGGKSLVLFLKMDLTLKSSIGKNRCYKTTILANIAIVIMSHPPHTHVVSRLVVFNKKTTDTFQACPSRVRAQRGSILETCLFRI